MEDEETGVLETLKKTHQALLQLHALLRHLRTDLETITKNYSTDVKIEKKNQN